MHKHLKTQTRCCAVWVLFRTYLADVPGDETMHWKQTSNPALPASTTVTGYEAVNVTHTENNWGYVMWHVEWWNLCICTIVHLHNCTFVHLCICAFGLALSI